MTETLIFTRQDVARLLPLLDCINAVEDAFRGLGLGEIPPPATLSLHSGGGSFHVKAGILPRAGRSYFSAKANGNFPGNPQKNGLPTIQGLLLLSDADDGRVLAVIDSGEITALRTAAATAVAARYLARPDAKAAVIVGAGVQGRVHLRALAEVLPLNEVFIYDVVPEKSRAFATEMSAQLAIEVHPSRDLASAAARADVCVTCTPATQFILDEGMVRPGTFIAGVGADNENKRELAPGLLATSRTITDLREQCARIGDLHHAIAAGAMTADDVYADLADIVSGKRAGRQDSEDVIVFDSTGLAIQDVAAAAAVFENALADAGELTRVSFSS